MKVGHRVLLAAVLALGATTPAWAQVKIGVTIPLTGFAASYGEDAKRGIDLAVACPSSEYLRQKAA